MDYLNSFKRYEYLWLQDKEEAYKQFLQSQPTLEDFENELKKYMNVEQEINSITSSYTIGSLCLQTTPLKNALKHEAEEWKSQYAKNLHQQVEPERARSGFPRKSACLCHDQPMKYRGRENFARGQFRWG